MVNSGIASKLNTGLLISPYPDQEGCQGRARFQQHGDASCHQVFFFLLQGKTQKEIHAILVETLACFLPGWAKDLSAPLYLVSYFYT